MFLRFLLSNSPFLQPILTKIVRKFPRPLWLVIIRYTLFPRVLKMKCYSDNFQRIRLLEKQNNMENSTDFHGMSVPGLCRPAVPRGRSKSESLAFLLIWRGHRRGSMIFRKRLTSQQRWWVTWEEGRQHKKLTVWALWEILWRRLSRLRRRHAPLQPERKPGLFP